MNRFTHCPTDYFAVEHPYYVEACTRIDAALEDNDDGVNQLVASLIEEIAWLKNAIDGAQHARL